MFDSKDIEFIKKAFGINDEPILDSTDIKEQFKDFFQKEKERIEEMDKLQQQIYNTGAIPEEYLFLKEDYSNNATLIINNLERKYACEL